MRGVRLQSPQEIKQTIDYLLHSKVAPRHLEKQGVACSANQKNFDQLQFKTKQELRRRGQGLASAERQPLQRSPDQTLAQGCPWPSHATPDSNADLSGLGPWPRTNTPLQHKSAERNDTEHAATPEEIRNEIAAEKGKKT